MTKLQDLLAQKVMLEQEIESTQKRERSEAIAKITTMMAEYGLSAADLPGKTGGKKSGGNKGRKVAAKYRNPATNDSWSGRGLTPKWLTAEIASGKKISDFKVT